MIVSIPFLSLPYLNGFVASPQMVILSSALAGRNILSSKTSLLNTGGIYHPVVRLSTREPLVIVTFSLNFNFIVICPFSFLITLSGAGTNSDFKRYGFDFEFFIVKVSSGTCFYKGTFNSSSIQVYWIVNWNG